MSYVTQKWIKKRSKEDKNNKQRHAPPPPNTIKMYFTPIWLGLINGNNFSYKMNLFLQIGSFNFLQYITKLGNAALHYS